MNKIILTELANNELQDAIQYYEFQVSGLGIKFKNEVESALKRISEYPHVWSQERPEVRKYLLNKFPYKILFSLEKDHILIIAIAHQHREPDYWVDEYRRE